MTVLLEYLTDCPIRVFCISICVCVCGGGGGGSGSTTVPSQLATPFPAQPCMHESKAVEIVDYLIC